MTPSPPRLAFAEEHGTPSGFRTAEGTTDEIVVRELVQNALDAGATEVQFETIRQPVERLPAIADYREAVAAILPDAAKTPTGKAALERIQGALRSREVLCLLCSDNGNGIDLPAYRSLLSEALSSKVDERAAGKLGSVGVGHLTALDASEMGYVLYASATADGERLFGGQTVLATQAHERQPDMIGDPIHRTGQGCLTAESHLEGFRGYEALPADPESVPDWLRRHGNGGTGTTVAIVAYRSFGENGAAAPDLEQDADLDRIFDALARHFTVALHNGSLRVAFVSDLRRGVVLDCTEVRSRLERNRNSKRAPKGQVGSGAKAWAAWQTLTEGDMIPLASLPDGGGGSVLWFRPTPGERPAVAVFRNGMRITDDAQHLRSYDFGAVNSFHAVLNAEGPLADLLRDCETDSHLEIKLSSAQEASKDRARRALKAVRDLLRGHAGEAATTDWEPELLRLFTAEARESAIKPAPPRRDREGDQDTLDLDGDDPEPVDGEGRCSGSGPRRSAVWRAGNRDGMSRTFVPNGKRRAVIGWGFAEAGQRRPSRVGVAVVVAGGSQPSDTHQAADVALRVRPWGEPGAEWGWEVVAAAGDRTVEVEVDDAPTDWEGVIAVVSRRA